MSLDSLHDIPRAGRVILAVVVVTLLWGSSLALAEEGENGTEEVDPVPIDYFPEEDLIVFSLPDTEGAFVDCSEGVVSMDENDMPVVDVEGCYAASTLGPNGQSNHGQVVRAFVHALKDLDLESLGYDGPRGQLVRNAARSDFGKKDFDDGEGAGLTATSSSHGKAKGKNKP